MTINKDLQTIGKELAKLVNQIENLAVALGKAEKSKAKSVQTKTKAMAPPAYSLPTRRRRRFDFPIINDDSFNNAKNGFNKPMIPFAANRAKAGAKITSRRTIDDAK